MKVKDLKEIDMVKKYELKIKQFLKNNKKCKERKSFKIIIEWNNNNNQKDKYLNKYIFNLPLQ